MINGTLLEDLFIGILINIPEYDKVTFTKVHLLRLESVDRNEFSLRSSGSIYTFMDIQIFQQNHVSTHTFFNILKFNMQIFQNTSIQHANI